MDVGDLQPSYLAQAGLPLAMTTLTPPLWNLPTFWSFVIFLRNIYISPLNALSRMAGSIASSSAAVSV